jgi:putative flippase GtrA
MDERFRFLSFVVVGGIAAVVNVLSRALFNLVMPYEAAIVAAFPMALTTAFVLNRVYVFAGTSGSIFGQYLRFLAVNLLALAQVWIVSVALARAIFPWLGFVWHAETVAHMIGVLSPVVTSYVGHQRFTFAQRSPSG